MSVQIVSLEDVHIEDAAGLACARYEALRGRVPCLPARYQDPGIVTPMLHDLIGQAPGVAAIRDRRLVGYLIGFVLAGWRGQRSMFSPEWANAAHQEGSRRIYAEMYAHLSARWVANGCFAHLVAVLAHDGEGIQAWHWLGFGLAAADAVRGLDAIHGVRDPITDLTIRRGGQGDVERALALDEALCRHLAAAPTFLAYTEPPPKRDSERWLANPANALWLAERDAEVVGGMRFGPASEDACTIIRDEGTSSIVGAFTREHARGRGIAATLLDRGLAWARAEGYERCAVDFEPMNVLAARFWTRYLKPVCYGLYRRVDERTAWAHEGRKDRDLW